MTSGVKQALPQVLMSKAGGEGKAARNHAPQADFAETLGMSKFSAKAKAEAKADLPETDTRAPWPRLASKLDEAIDRTQDMTSKLEAKIDPSKDSDKDDLPDIKPETRGEPSAVKDAASSSAAHNIADVPPTPASTPVTASVAEEADTQPYTEASPVEDRPLPAERDIVLSKPTSAPAPESNGEKSFVPMGRGEQAEAIRFEPAARMAASTEQPPSDHSSDQPKEALPDVSAEPAKTAPRITVVAQQNIPAPTPSTALVLVESIAASDLLDPSNTRLSLDAIHASTTLTSAQSLKIQLHPAELGMVTATLRFAGEQLSIELQVENHEAYRRLASDSETIVGSLRDLGYDVERVTVLQSPIATTPSARSDASASMPSPQGRSAEQFGSGMANGGGGNSGGRAAGEDGNQGRSGQHPSTQRTENSGSGLFI